MSARIAVVEDEAEIRSLIVEELEDEGYQVACAENGKAGLELIQSIQATTCACQTSPCRFLTDMACWKGFVSSSPFIRHRLCF